MWHAKIKIKIYKNKKNRGEKAVIYTKTIAGKNADGENGHHTTHIATKHIVFLPTEQHWLKKIQFAETFFFIQLESTSYHMLKNNQSVCFFFVLAILNFLSIAMSVAVTPVWDHHCKDCIFLGVVHPVLGNTTPVDMYICAESRSVQNMVTVTRTGNDLDDFNTWGVNNICQPYGANACAVNLAADAGIITRNRCEYHHSTPGNGQALILYNECWVCSECLLPCPYLWCNKM